MNNFIFENKTKVYFGKGGVKEYLGSLLVNYGETVMLAYGGGSIKRNGVYDEIMGILNAAGKRVVEFDRIMSNPTYAKRRRAQSWRGRIMWTLSSPWAAAACQIAARSSPRRPNWTRTFGNWRTPSTHSQRSLSPSAPSSRCSVPAAR